MLQTTKTIVKLVQAITNSALFVNRVHKSIPQANHAPATTVQKRRNVSRAADLVDEPKCHRDICELDYKYCSMATDLKQQFAGRVLLHMSEIILATTFLSKQRVRPF